MASASGCLSPGHSISLMMGAWSTVAPSHGPSYGPASSGAAAADADGTGDGTLALPAADGEGAVPGVSLG